MIHTVISWDCAFRNFFHLIDSLVKQNYDRSKFELIFVEQRRKEYADGYNHNLGLKSLWDRYMEVKNEINFKVIYLEEDISIPYHLGRMNNAGIDLAKGQIVSVMDGDLLVPPDFLKKLDNYFDKKGRSVVNLFRHMASRPVNVCNEKWAEQLINLKAVLNECPTKDDMLPSQVTNKGPLISALKKDWDDIHGYDMHIVWSTGLTRLGQDATARLELQTNTISSVLPDCYSVHPWHPIGFKRNTDEALKILSLHEKLIAWSKNNMAKTWRERSEYCEDLYSKQKKDLDKIIFSETLGQPGGKYIRKNNFLRKIDISIGKILKKTSSALKKQKIKK